MNKERQNLLNSCLKKYAPLVTVTVESGEKLIELHNNEVCYFQIKWKLTPSSRHFAKLKNTCRIACTKDGKFKTNTIISFITALQLISSFS